MPKTSLTAGITQDYEVIYHVYYGSALTQKKCKTFRDENAADKFFREKQKANLHVEVYKEEIDSVRTITRLA